MKKVLSIVAAALLTLSLHATTWTFTSIQQTDFYPTGQGAVDGNYWSTTQTGTITWYQYMNINTADELYVADGQKFAPTEGLKFLTRGNYFRAFCNTNGIRLQNPNTTGTNPSIVIPACKAGSDLAITVKRDGSNAATMAVSNASVASLELDGTVQNYSATVLADGDVVINMSAGTGYIRSVEVVEHSVYDALATKEVVTLFADEVTGVETTCTTHRDARTYVIEGTTYSNVQAWQLGTSNNLTFRVKNAKKVTFVGRAANNRGFAISLNGAAAENVMNTTGNEAYVQEELTLADGINTISITGVGGAVYPLAFIVEKDAEAIATLSGASMTFSNKDLIIYNGNIALSTVTNSSSESDQGFAKSSTINLYTSNSAEGKTAALRVKGTSTVTIAAPSNYVIEKIGVRAATEAQSGERTIKINNANGENYGVVVENQESHYHEWELATPSNQLTLSTSGSMYFIITLFGYQTETFPVTISHGWASFCSAEDVILPAGLTAYVATGSTTNEILLEEAGDVIKGGTGVVLEGADGTYDLTITTGAPALSSVLNGTVKRIANPGTVYCLNSAEGAFQQYNGAYIPANKAYFVAPAGAPARMAIRIGHVATDIDANVNVNANTNKVLRDGQILIVRGEKMYNLQGQLVK